MNETAQLAADVAACARELARGEFVALSRLFDLTSQRLVRYAHTVTRDWLDAEDAFQSAFVKIARRPAMLADARMPWAYLLRIVRNESLKIVNGRRHGRLLPAVGAGAGPDAALDREEQAEFVRRAVESLPSEQSEVILLKVWEEMTFAEVAEVTGESPNTVASRYRYALQKLTRALESINGGRDKVVSKDSSHGSRRTGTMGP